MNLDKKLAEKIFLPAKQSPVLSKLAILGAAKLVWFLAVVVLLWSVFSGKVLVAVVSVLAAWALQLSLSFLIQRRRPFQQNHEKPLLHLLWPTPSFPSGHTTISCAMAAAVFVSDPWWGSIFFLVAGLVAFCRIAVGVHYFSDIIGGAILGIGVASLISKFL